MNALDVLCAQLTRDLFAIAKFLLAIGRLLLHCWYSLGRPVTIGTPMVWSVFDNFLSISTVYYSSKTVKDSQTAKNDHWCHMSTQSPPNTQSRALPSHVPGQWPRGLVICELRTANWRTGNMRTNMRTRPLIGRDVTRVPRAVRKVPHGVRSSHCFVSRPNEPYCSIAESRCICIFMSTVFGQLFVSVT